MKQKLLNETKEENRKRNNTNPGETKTYIIKITKINQCTKSQFNRNETENFSRNETKKKRHKKQQNKIKNERKTNQKLLPQTVSNFNPLYFCFLIAVYGLCAWSLRCTSRANPRLRFRRPPIPFSGAGLFSQTLYPLTCQWIDPRGGCTFSKLAAIKGFKIK